MGGPKLLIFPVFYFVLIPVVAGHGYIKSWASDDLQFQKAQKQPLSETAFRNAPSNIGWIGSKFINTPAFVCGASETPNEQVAPPGGTVFSSQDQSAKKTLSVNAGGKVTLIVAGNEGEGIAFGQSSSEEGHQDQYYVFCGQIAVKGGSGSSPIPDDDQPTVKLPGAFKPGNISPDSLPIPVTLAQGSKGEAQTKSADTDSKETQSTDSSDTSSPADHGDSKAAVNTGCADLCYKQKLTELKDLAPSCSADQFTCICKSQPFVKAYQSCCNDNCTGNRETRAAVNEIYNKCDSAESPSDDSDDHSK
ncbi:hypothetical protein PtB15_11B113 [Puccinia triticina]|nr:hypothetical protein PtB15_11B113 [Puccinia triticina]